MHRDSQTPTESASRLELRVLGPVAATRAGLSVSLGGAKQRAVLAMLLLDAGRVIPSDRLADELWRGRPPPGAANTLRSYVSRLRGPLSPDATVTAHGGGYVLELERAWVDAARFEGLIKVGQAALTRGDVRVAAERFRDGLALWHGRALADVIDVETLALESRRLEELRIEALEGRIEAELELGLHAELVGELERLVAEHPLRERLWRQLVLALYRCERQADALAAYRRARAVLTEEVGLEPGEELRSLQHAVLRHEVPPLAPRPPPHNLPAPLTSFVGRERELTELERLLAETRLLTLTGLGGVGKTRLATELAARVVGTYPDGLWFLDLSGIADPSLVPQQLAALLGLRESPDGRLLEILRNQLRTSQLLLVFDNCEHLLPSSADLIETLLLAAPQLRILATSREPLSVTGEVEYALRPLEVPPAAADPEAAASSGAVRLFFDRGSAISGLVAAPNAVSTVARICRDLDGIPLAIELAAARTRALSVDEIAANLDDRFGFLKYWRRVAVPRHQTLRATMDWSYDLLSDGEKGVLRRLSVFADGFTLRAAAGLCAAGDEGKALETVARLVERSLVIADVRSGATRYRLLETVRQYASERLAESGEVDVTRRNHAEFFCIGAELAAPGLVRGDQTPAVVWFEQETANLRAALEWARDHDEELELRLVAAVVHFWNLRGQWSEANRWIDRALGVAEPAPARARLLQEAALLARLRRNFPEARALAKEGLELHERLGDSSGAARCLNTLAAVAGFEGDWHEAKRLSEESMQLALSIDDVRTAGFALFSLADAGLFLGRYDDSWRSCAEALQLFRRIDHGEGIALALAVAAFAAAAENRRSEAEHALQEALTVSAELRFPEALSWCLDATATFARDHEAAARLLGAAERLREGIIARPTVERIHERRERDLASVLGAERLETLRAEGAGMELEEAVSYALATLDTPAGS